MIEVRKYTKEDRGIWNNFIFQAKNATFLFDRNFIEYHEDRFVDHSLVILTNNKIIALLPANINKNMEIVSHSGLTYGGLVVSKEIGLNLYLKIFKEMLKFLNTLGFKQLKLKILPVFYCQIPSQEHAYAMFLTNAKIYRLDTALTINQDVRLVYQGRRIRSIKKGNKGNYFITKDNNFSAFWKEILEPNLFDRFGTKPIHSLSEIELLAEKFPNNISQINIYDNNNKIVAGATIFETETVAHAQYISANDYGRKFGALDKLFDEMIRNIYNDKKYFDFGISNEQSEKMLNHGLLDWKEGFGGRTYVHEFYAIDTDKYNLLNEVVKND